jgi:hypothetical protein
VLAEEDPEARRAEEHREEEDAKLDAGEPEEDDDRPYTARSRRRRTGHQGGQRSYRGQVQSLGERSNVSQPDAARCQGGETTVAWQEER